MPIGLKKKGITHSIAIAVVAVLVVIGVAITAATVLGQQGGKSETTTPGTSTSAITTNSSTFSSTSGSQVMQGILTGYVTVSPSQPACPVNQSCNVNMTGYSLEFASQCPNVTSSTSVYSCQSKMYSAPLSPGGHYSILLPPGAYEITGLLPSCNWTGCSSTLPMSVVVEAGQQIVVNVDIDTGIT